MTIQHVSRLSDFVRSVAISQKKATDERRKIAGENIFRHFEDYDDLKKKAVETNNYRNRVLAFERCRSELYRLIDDVYDMRPSADQHRLFDLMRDTMFIKFYNGDISALMADADWLRETLQVQDVKDGLQVEYPRRSGKSWTEIIVSIVTALSISAKSVGNIYCISPTAEQARDWLSQFMQFLSLMKDHPEFGYTVLQHREGKNVVIRSKYTGREVTITVRGNASQKAHVNSLRGGGKGLLLLILDEFNFFCDEAFGVILPLLANGAALVLTSSMAVKEKVAAALAEACYKNGDKVLHVVRWRVGCTECTQKQEQTGKQVSHSFSPSSFHPTVREVH